MKLANRVLNRLVVALGRRLELTQPAVAATSLPRFATDAPGLVIKTPREIVNPELIRIGRDVKIGPNSVIKATTSFPGGWLQHPDGEHVSQSFDPMIEIGDRVTATWALQVVAFSRVTIEDDVMFAGNIYVSDGGHGTIRGDLPYKYQGIEGIAPVVIGQGSWLGQNAVILPGTTIGENSVVGANSVVSGKIPARSLAVGAPARVVRVWDDRSESWVKPGAESKEAAALNTEGAQ